VLINASAIDLPQVMRVEIDPTVLLFATVVVAILMAVLTMVPMVQLRYARHSVALHAGGRSIGVERGRARTRHSLLVAQVALALLLLVGSGLMVRTFAALRDVDPGFRNPEAVQTFQIALSEADAGTIDEAVRMQQTIAEGLAAIPGVEQAAFAAFNDGLPMDGDGRSGPMYIQGRSTTDEPPPSREIGFVSPEFFATLVTPLLAGRTFTWDDIYSRQPVTVVSENLARSEWGSAEAALGRQIGFGPSGPWFEVVGVVKDLRYNGLSSPAPESAVFPIVTAGDRPGGSRFATYLVRSDRAGTAALLAEIQQAVGAVSSNVAVANARTLGALYERSMSRTSLALLVLVSTGSIALLLGLVGIYGVYSYAVSLRRREIAIRAALGAQQSQLRRMFLTHAVVLTGIGVVIGIGIAMALTQYISSQLFGVSPLDPVTYAASALVLVTTGAIAAYLPARRASELDPQAVLASE
jgi:predicted permease